VTNELIIIPNGGMRRRCKDSLKHITKRSLGAELMIVTRQVNFLALWLSRDNRISH